MTTEMQMNAATFSLAATLFASSTLIASSFTFKRPGVLKSYFYKSNPVTDDKTMLSIETLSCMLTVKWQQRKLKILTESISVNFKTKSR